MERFREARELEAFRSFFQPGASHLDAALAYASIRIHIFPLIAGEKRPLEGSHGVQDATTKADTIKRWFERNPTANIGIGLRKSNVVILDVDPRNGGDETLDRFIGRFGPLPPTFTVNTGNQGQHFYFRVSPDFYDSLAEDLPKKLGKGLDLLVNGYAVAPPSKLVYGDFYTTAAGTLEEDFAALPIEWLQRVTTELMVEKDRAVWQEDENWAYHTGERNNGMASLAGYFRRVGFTAEEIFYMLKVVGPSRFEHFEEISDREIWTTARSIANYRPSDVQLYQSSVHIRAKRRVPELSEAALHGPIGDWVRYIEPITEAHPAALLAQALVIFGSMIAARDREDISPGFVVEGTYHRTGLFAMIVGDTAKAAKGDSWSRAWELMSQVDPRLIYLTGVQTGEGIIDYLADDEPLEEKTRIKHGEEIEEIQHVRKGSRNDRRCLVFEPEFGRVLHVAERRGSVVKDILRDLWDSGSTGKITAASKQRVTEATLSMVGHITKPELERDFDPTDFMNGFGNRFMYIYAKRTKRLSGDDAPALTTRELRSLTAPLKEALKFAQEEAPADYELTDKAWEFWEQIDVEMWRDHYSELINHVTARNRPIVRRLAVVYAVADCSPFIRLIHLEAAWALWQYCLATAEYIFGDQIGDRDADKLYRALLEHPAGLKLMEISRDVYKGNRSAKQIQRALRILNERGLIASRKGKAGRKTVEFFFAKPNIV